MVNRVELGTILLSLILGSAILSKSHKPMIRHAVAESYPVYPPIPESSDHDPTKGLQEYVIEGRLTSTVI